jgi:hypothetical protein
VKAIATILAVTVMLASSACGQYIWINLSYKVILNPSDGTRPPGATGATDARLQQAISEMNALLDTFGRHYRMRLAHAPIEISGNYENGPGFWYAWNLFDELGQIGKDFMESLAKEDANYAWRGNAINIYVNAGTPGGICSFPQEDEEIIIIGAGGAANGAHHLHEIGHYFGLYHTQGRACGCCGDGDGECDEPEDDQIDDTLPDLPCWDRNQISMNAFGVSFADASSIQKKLVDDTIGNVMSYHSNPCGNGVPRTQLTERQLDVWSDFANGSRRAVVSGATLFFDWRNDCRDPIGNSVSLDFPDDCVLGPFPNLSPLASLPPEGGDRVAVIRPGNYPGPITITRAMTLVATRAGPVTLGQ